MRRWLSRHAERMAFMFVVSMINGLILFIIRGVVGFEYAVLIGIVMILTDLDWADR